MEGDPGSSALAGDPGVGMWGSKLEEVFGTLPGS